MFANETKYFCTVWGKIDWLPMKKNVALTDVLEKNVCFALSREKIVRLRNAEKKIVRCKGY